MLADTNNIHILHHQWLYLIPLLILFLFLKHRSGSAGFVFYPTVRLVSQLLSHPKDLAGRVGNILLVLAGIMLVIALARPQLINEKERIKVNGVDIMIAFDLSGSMEIPDMVLQGRRVMRLNAAKFVTMDFIKKRPNDRIGLVGFSGKTRTFSPITLDHAVCQYMINNFQLGMFEEDGTAIGSALAAAATRLEDIKTAKSRIIILVTDGASNSGKLSPLEASKAVAKLGIRIYTIAVGTDGSGDFDEPTLKEIATMTGGEHFRAKDTGSMLNAFTSIDKLEKSEAEKHIVRRIQELFPWFLTAALFLATLGIAAPLTTRPPAP